VSPAENLPTFPADLPAPAGGLRKDIITKTRKHESAKAMEGEHKAIATGAAAFLLFVFSHFRAFVIEGHGIFRVFRIKYLI
jgi:hypothetical protein